MNLGSLQQFSVLMMSTSSDIDFEFPTSAQSQAFLSLMQELRAGLDAWAVKKGETNPYQLTVSHPSVASHDKLVHAVIIDGELCWCRQLQESDGRWHGQDSYFLEPDGVPSPISMSLQKGLTHYVFNRLTTTPDRGSRSPTTKQTCT